MLQQTQVDRVAVRFPRFMRRFPTVAALADAGSGAVISEWQGLGYNRRAVALHRAAVIITREHGGRVPGDIVALEKLPGVGPYTARAVLAFAFEAPVAPVDVNVARVLARAVTGGPLSRADAQRVADGQLHAGLPAAQRPAVWSQALMDLGSRHCKAAAPRCDTCPALAECAWRQTRTADPAKASGVRSQTQSTFRGSNRQHRGMLLNAIRGAPVAAEHVAEASGLSHDPGRAERLARALVADGLATYDHGRLTLP